MRVDAVRHQQVRELLPWFLADALDSAEASRVAAHLEICAECRAELEAESELRELVRSAATPRIAPHTSSFARLVARVDAAERRRLGARARRLTSTLRGWTGRWISPRRLRIGALVVVHNVVLVLVVIGIMRHSGADPAVPGPEVAADRSAAFETRSSGSPRGARTLRLVFRDDVAMWEIVDLLREHRLQLVSGPSQVGAFEVEAPAENELSEVVDVLRRNPRVRLVAGWP